MAVIVNEQSALTVLLDRLTDLPVDPPSLYLKLAGRNVGKHGAISLITLLLHPTNKVYIIDVPALQPLLFEVKGEKGVSLKDILESTTIPKIFFDVRRDANALYFLHAINLQNVEDVQLQETAARWGHVSYKRVLKSFDQCVEQESKVDINSQKTLSPRKDYLKEMREAGFSSSVHPPNQRPISPKDAANLAEEIAFVPLLRAEYCRRLRPRKVWTRRLQQGTHDRVSLCQTHSFRPPIEGCEDLSPWQMPAKPHFKSRAEKNQWNNDILDDWTIEQNLGYRDTESGEEEARLEEDMWDEHGEMQIQSRTDTTSGQDKNRSIAEMYQFAKRLLEQS